MLKNTEQYRKILKLTEEGVMNTTDTAKHICEDTGTIDDRKYGKAGYS